MPAIAGPDEHSRKYILPNSLKKKLEQRAPRVPGGRDLNEAMSTTLSRYFYLLEEGTDEVLKAGITNAELLFLCDICNGTDFNIRDIPALHIEVEDAEPDFSKKWEIAPEQLSEKLKKMSLLALLAIVDTIERFWNDPDQSKPGLIPPSDEVKISI